MAMRDLIPWGRDEGRMPSLGLERSEMPFFTLHREIDRLFDDMMRGWGRPEVREGARGGGWPSLEVSDSDKELRICAELPGLTENDVELSVDDGVLTIRGERRQESDDKARGYSERYYGRFERRIALPGGVKEDEAKASFQDGLLTVTLPKAPEAAHGKRIPINAETRH